MCVCVYIYIIQGLGFRVSNQAINDLHRVFRFFGFSAVEGFRV